jgi:hypothetical protein
MRRMQGRGYANNTEGICRNHCLLDLMYDGDLTT